MKIITPRGNLIKIERVARVCEKRIDFNGEKRDLFELAKNTDVPATGLALKVVENTSNVFGCQEIYIGNLKPETVNEVLKNLLTQGYFDFTQFEYQDAKEQKDIVLDDGVSKPFCSELTNTMLIRRNFTGDMELLEQPMYRNCNPFNNMCGTVLCDGINEDEICEDDTECSEGEDSEE